MTLSSAARSALLRYGRIQTAGLLATWMGFQFFDFAKPGLVANHLNPQWVLLLLLISATLSVFLAPRGNPPRGSPHRWAVATAAGLVALFSASSVVSSPVGWLVGIAVWGSTLAALGAPTTYD